MSIELSPDAQLGFQRPLTQTVKQQLVIKNTSTSVIAFKVKTTSPKQYCVRPNAGTIEPGSSQDIQVVSQPMLEEPLESQKCKDKFLVQSIALTPEREGIDLTDLWHVVERNAKSEIHEKKLRCVYLPASGAPAQGSSSPASHESLDPHEKRTSVMSTSSTSSGQSAASLATLNQQLAKKVESLQAESRKQEKTIQSLRAESKSLEKDLQESRLALKQYKEDIIRAIKEGKTDRFVPNHHLTLADQHIPLTTAILISVLSFLISWYFF
ncbi:MAG: PapD-like protein [Piptocephalis tieghemiana]|nr:MAG: PapD-like protein [Piptocephalis tieghemiana]